MGDWKTELFAELKANKDDAKSAWMAAYMKNKFQFLGVPTPIRRKICRKYFALAPNSGRIDADFIDLCYQSDFREHQYAAVDYLLEKHPLLVKADFKIIEKLITTKSWWDTVDGLDKAAGLMADAFPDLSAKILKWSLSENIWLRRAAIDHQLYRNEKTDVSLLSKIIINNFGQKEFFINKAIGWALREYAKTDPDWVINFINEHRDKMAKLSLREALKHL